MWNGKPHCKPRRPPRAPCGRGRERGRGRELALLEVRGADAPHTREPARGRLWPPARTVADWSRPQFGIRSERRGCPAETKEQERRAPAEADPWAARGAAGRARSPQDERECAGSRPARPARFRTRPTGPLPHPHPTGPTRGVLSPGAGPARARPPPLRVPARPRPSRGPDRRASHRPRGDTAAEAEKAGPRAGEHGRRGARRLSPRRPYLAPGDELVGVGFLHQRPQLAEEGWHVGTLLHCSPGAGTRISTAERGGKGRGGGSESSCSPRTPTAQAQQPAAPPPWPRQARGGRK